MATLSSILAWKSHGQSSLADYSPWGRKRVGHDWTHTCWVLLLLLSRITHVWLCATPWTAAYQAPPSLGLSRQEHWSGLPFPSPMHESEKWMWSRSVVSDSSWPHGLQPTRLLHPWDSPGKSTGVGRHRLLHTTSAYTTKYKINN